MKPEKIEKLLGGYATGTLNEDERKALFAASLTDQNLFNALADEQALRDLLSDATARQQLLSALEPKSRRWFERPLSWALAGSFAMALIAGIVLTRTARQPVFQSSVFRPPAPPVPPVASERRAQPRTFQNPAPRSAKPPKLDASRIVLPTPPSLQPQPMATAIEAITVSEPVLGTAAKSSAPAQALDVHLAVMKRTPDGEYVKVDPSAWFEAGDTVRLRITPTMGGHVYLQQREGRGAWATLASRQVAANTAFTSNDIRLGEGPGEKTIRVVLAPVTAARATLSSFRSESETSRANAQGLVQRTADLAGGSPGAVVKEITLSYR